jgi:hypothetical protein
MPLQQHTTDAATTESVRDDICEYLEGSPDVTAEGSLHGWRWVRWVDGDWRVVNSGGKHRLNKYLYGKVVTPGEIKGWLLSNPVQLHATCDAYRHDGCEHPVWEAVERQSVFTDENRCFWCGVSESHSTLNSETAVEHGDIHLCNDCRPAWVKQDELIE